VGAKRVHEKAGGEEESAEEAPGEEHGVEPVGAAFESEQGRG
jgi:hypothetical protein